MNKHQKELIINAVEELSKVHKMLQKQLIAGNSDDINNMLVECQDLAIRIGNRIEMLEGMNAPGICFLEKYCEMLYQYSISIERLIHDPLEAREALDKVLFQARHAIEKEIKTRYEIVFLPYKASMWDSLESIWIAAEEDKRCSCRVIPIPYYDKNPNGSFGNEYFDGDQFPEEIPITNYGEYDLEENKPDIIYFHNPYDKHNFITSVHPSFYSSELKKHTNLLVYVPYFVTDDRIPEHLCETVGVFMADKVIVQSEVIKEKYIESYINVLGKGQKEKEALTGTVNEDFWRVLCRKADEKFLPLGSPKIDKVINLMKKKSDLPKDWERVIRYRAGRQDGEDISDIKLILYNTSVTNLLNYKEQAIKKIKAVLDIFKNRTDAVLLWRPHPLNESTLKSMVPEILDEYLRIVSQYQQEAYGIYDTSANLHRAISVSDAYYGDAHSSIIQLFGVTGKPVMFQNMQITEELTKEERYSIEFENFTYDGEYIWFAATDHNGLYRMDVRTKETEFIGRFPDEPEDGVRLYLSCTLHEDKLFFAPFLANTGAIYNLKNGEFTSLKANDSNAIIMTRPEKYTNIVSYKSKIFMLPCLYPAIGCYSVAEDRMSYIHEWLEELKKKCMLTDDAYSRRYCIVDEKYLMLPLCNTNAVLEYDMDGEKWRVFKVGDDGNSFSGICYDGSYYWLSPRNEGPIVRWDKISQIYVNYDDFPGDYARDRYSFLDIIFCSGYLWIFPLSANMVLKMHPITGVIESVSIFDSYIKPLGRRKKKFHWISTDGVKIYAGAVFGNAILSYDPQHHTINKCHAAMNIAMRKTVLRKYVDLKIDANASAKQYYFYNEDGRIGINDYLEILLNDKENIRIERRNSFQRLFTYADGTCGQTIHKNMLLMF